jgi:hypothetical protein
VHRPGGAADSEDWGVSLVTALESAGVVVSGVDADLEVDGVWR